MILERVRIKNFRSCADFEFSLTDYTVLVGYNNAGKSNALRAVRWLVNPEALHSKDFRDSSEDVVVYGTIHGIEEEHLDRVSEAHRQRIEPYCLNGCLRVKRTMDHSNLKKAGISLFVTDTESTDYDQCDWKKNPTGIDQALHALFPDCIEITGMSNAADDVMKSSNRTTIGQIVNQIIGTFKTQHEAAFEKALSSIRELVDAQGGRRPKELSEVDILASHMLNEIFPGIDLRVHIDMPTVDDLFKGSTIKTVEDGSQRDVDALGFGTQRSIQIALLRCLSELSSGQGSGSRTLILVEEPELYLHPYAVELTKSALERLSKADFQVVATTHAPQFVDAKRATHAVLVRKGSNGTYALPTMTEQVKQTIAEAPAQSDLLFSLSNASQILFAEVVLFVEGKTERRLLPYLYEAVTSRTLMADKIAMVSMDGVTNLANLRSILKAMGLPAIAVVDLDYAFKHGVSEGLIPDTPKQAVLDYVGSNADRLGITLDEGGLPRKGDGITAAKAWELLAAEDAVKPQVIEIHTALRSEGVWMWTRGTIEPHLGITGKNENTWAGLAARMAGSSLQEAVSDADSIDGMVRWIKSCAT